MTEGRRKKLKHQVIASAAKQSLPEKEIASSPVAPRNDTTSLFFKQSLRNLPVSSFHTVFSTSIPPQLTLHFERDPAGRTFLARQFVTYPFFLTTPFYLDETLAGMPSLILQSVSGGLYQDERLALSLTTGVGAQVHCTTQSATVVHSMAENRDAYQVIYISAAAGALVEYLPGPMILFPHAGLRTAVRVVAEASATVVIGEAFLMHDPAAQSRRFGLLSSETSVRRPDGRLLCLDRFQFAGDERMLVSPGVLHHFQAQGTLWIVCSASMTELLAGLRETLNGVANLYAGASTLPNNAGVWARFLASDAVALSRGFHAAWSAVRRVLTGRELERRHQVGWL
jgi:urease accessory protein